VKEILDETGLLPRLLELEVPEEVVSAPPRTLDVLHRLKELGVALVLDGMAVRPPALSRLSALPVDGVKLDLTSLRQRPPGAREISLLGTLAAVARALDLRVSAQGVESVEDVELLRRLGCVEAQGFHIGPPVAAGSFGERLARQVPRAVEGVEQ
jgi:EAL domain-containing protein (putative c-di-GMP-specific phosphodiesterase class I)